MNIVDKIYDIWKALTVDKNAGVEISNLDELAGAGAEAKTLADIAAALESQATTAKQDATQATLELVLAALGQTLNTELNTATTDKLLEVGAATGGSKTTLVDDTRDYEADILNGAIIKLTIGGADYYRKITIGTGPTITFNPLPGTPDTAVWGDAEGPQITVVTVADGDSGYTIEAESGAGSNVPLSAALVGTVITVILATDENGDPDNAENTGVAVAGVINELDEFAASMTGSGGVVAATLAPVDFSGGVDPVEVTPGTRYKILFTS